MLILVHFLILGAFISFVLSICPSAWNNLPAFATIFKKFASFENFSKARQENSTYITILKE